MAHKAKMVNFPDPTLEQFMADLKRTGSAIADLDDRSHVELFRERVRRACRRQGIRTRTGHGDRLERDSDGTERWTYGGRVWAFDVDWEITPEQRLQERMALERLGNLIGGRPSRE